ncbi:MAG TPA: alanyl-tRNA editing protein [Bryobacteraceae bacterium]|nr:alanyl-tRNA editing protein [Bryobacteraceae bacterium]
MTDRLYYHDSYLTEFRARVVETSPDRQRIYLDRTAFYATSGGQPFDIGKLGGVDVTDVVDEDGRIAHQLSAPLETAEVSGVIDWPRRFDHMQQHTGQHLLSAVLVNMFNAQTVSFHLGVESCTIDVARSLDPAQIRQAERRANEIVFENRPVTVGFEDSSKDLGLRKPTEREGEIRIISIQDLDRSACGGTHVKATGEIGPILIRKLDRIRGNQRIEFLCGLRAVKRARADFEAISSVARAFSAAPDEVPALVATQFEKLQESDKARRRLAAELAQARGRELYAATAPGPDGIRKVVRRVASLTDELRAEAQSFTTGQKSVFLAMGENPPAIMLASSPDSGMNAGEFLKTALAKAGGRGGGTATMAQGSLPSKDLLDQFVLP